MKKLFLLAAFALPICLLAQNKMTTEMLWSLKRVSGEGLSNDGSKVFYASKQTDVKTEKSATEHYEVNISTGRVFLLRNVKNVFQRDNGVWYATDGENILRSTDDGKTWGQFCKKPEDMDNMRVSPDGRKIACSKDVIVQPMHAKDIYIDLPKSNAQVYTDLNYRHWDTWEDGKFSHLFIMDAGGKTPMDITPGEAYDVPQKPFGGVEDFVWSADSKGLLYVSKKKSGKEYAQSTNTDLYFYDLKTKNTVNWTPGMHGYDVAPAFSPDGKYVAWTSMAHDGFEADKNDIWVMDAKTQHTWKMNLTENWDGTVESFNWSNDGKRIYFLAAWKGTQQLFNIEVPFGKTEKPSPKKITGGDFDINGYIGETEKNIIVSRCDMNHASELYSVNKEDGSMNALTHENDKAYGSIKLSKTELKRIKTTDGQTMGVWVIYPPDFDPAKKYPTLLYCQGGPQSALTQFYSFRWNFQLMAANGYIVVAPNRRGMPGWGVKWNADISKDWGGQPMRDYLSAIDAIAEESYVDKNRLGCVGASYGGYSVFMLAGMHNNRFKSFIAHDGLFDLKSWYGTTEELWFANWDIGGAYWDKKIPEGYAKFNPSNFVDKWNTPIMIVQGGIDYRVPIEQGLEAFQAAQLRGIKSKLLYLPDENHWVLHPQNAMVWQREFYKWLSETL